MQIRALAGLRGCAEYRTQNIQFGMARADRLGDQVAEHIGGYMRAGADQR